jgi:ABC-2 type transport system permease protein
MTDMLTYTTRPAVRRTRASGVSLVALEIRKSLSTRSGKAVALAAAALAPAATAMLSFSGDELDAVRGPIGALGMVTALVLFPLGVLATAGEWSHRTVQTTFLLAPDRTAVVVAKAVAVAVLGAVLAAIAAAATAVVLWSAPIGDPSWDGAVQALAVSVAAGAAFAVVGAGAGAALGSTPAALTGLYLTVLGAMPALRLVRPAVAEKLDPANAVLQLAIGGGTTSHTLTVVGWVVVTTVAGVVITRRRAVS